MDVLNCSSCADTLSALDTAMISCIHGCAISRACAVTLQPSGISESVGSTLALLQDQCTRSQVPPAQAAAERCCSVLRPSAAVRAFLRSQIQSCSLALCHQVVVRRTLLLPPPRRWPCLHNRAPNSCPLQAAVQQHQPAVSHETGSRLQRASNGQEGPQPLSWQDAPRLPQLRPPQQRQHRQQAVPWGRSTSRPLVRAHQPALVLFLCKQALAGYLP